MPTKTQSFHNAPGTNFCPDQLTMELIQTLKRLLITNQYLTYKTAYNTKDVRHELNIEGQLDFHFHQPIDKNRIHAIRQASDAWNSLELIYRLTVLDAYATLFREVLNDYDPVEKTILFCQIFVNDFVGVITSH
ncbi:hypothetical protein [Mucilaginibacter lappiensis]|uniref:hypothetical protein n=1 Tax=Mucilaginibacter lappiensis TaxID=354630 RepID=UPI003D251DE4